MRRFSRLIIIGLVSMLLCSSVVSAYAVQEETTAYPVNTTTNNIDGWPQGPEINSGAAVVIEAETGAVLYEKNMNETGFPASITKIMTAILTLENASLNDMVYFTDEAVFSVPRNSSHIAVTPGEEITVENCLYGLMLASANEVANALGEHVSGSMDAFVELMNQRARELGAVNTHFNNTNGLPDDNHYTTCYDMAMISRAAVNNEAFVKINSTISYFIPPTNLQSESRPVNSLHPLLISGPNHYEGCFGGKTGYTTVAGNTLVTFARRNGMTLISVVMKSDSENVNKDSTAILNYGFENFQKLNISQYETKFNFSAEGLFQSSSSIFESSHPEIEVNKDGIIILPKGMEFSEAQAQVSFSDSQGNEGGGKAFAEVSYTYNGHFVGGTTLDIISPAKSVFSFAAAGGETETAAGEEPATEPETQAVPAQEKKYLTINIWYVLIAFGVLAMAGLAAYLMVSTRRQRTRLRHIRIQKKHLHRIERNRRRRRNYPTRKFY